MPKVHENPSITFWVILLPDKQTDRETNDSKYITPSKLAEVGLIKEPKYMRTRQTGWRCRDRRNWRCPRRRWRERWALAARRCAGRPRASFPYSRNIIIVVRNNDRFYVTIRSAFSSRLAAFLSRDAAHIVQQFSSPVCPSKYVIGPNFIKITWTAAEIWWFLHFSRWRLSKFQFFNGQHGQEGGTASLRHILSKSLQPWPRYRDFSIFQDSGRRHLGFLKFEIFNG